MSELLAELQGGRRLTLSRALGRGQRYLPMIQRILAQEGLPEDLAYLALVESHFQPDARSPAGAVGLWQFIATTARASGLRVDWWVDERLDPELATRAAARHLKELYAQFNSWDLALAAYNAGPGGVSRMLAATGARTFWELVAAGAVRSETARYVPKFYAAVAVAREPDRYGVEVVGRQAPLAYDTVRVDTPVDLVTAARLCGAAPARLVRLNPALVRRCTPPGQGRYPLRVPPGSGNRLVRALDGLSPAERLSFQRYRLRAGDTLWGVGRRFGTRPTAIAQLNGITDPRSLRPGRELVVPVPAGGLKRRSSPVDGGGHGRPVHVVRPGDTVSGIARAYGTTVERILAWNGLGRDGLIRPGQVLAVGAALRVAAGGAPVHVVRPGDTLWALARRYGVSLSDLRRWNGLPPGAVLRPGDRLRVAGDDPS